MNTDEQIKAISEKYKISGLEMYEDEIVDGVQTFSINYNFVREGRRGFTEHCHYYACPEVVLQMRAENVSLEKLAWIFSLLDELVWGDLEKIVYDDTELCAVLGVSQKMLDVCKI